MEKHLRKHLRRETPAKRNPGGSSSQPHSSPGKGVVGSSKACRIGPRPMPKGPLIFSTVVLRTIKVGLATRPTVMGEVLACCNFSASRKSRMFKR